LVTIVELAVTSQTVSPRGLFAFAIFLCFAATMAALAAFLLLFPGTPLDHLWALNSRAHHDLTALGKWVGLAFILLAGFLVYAARLWFCRRARGWLLAVIIVVLEATGNVVNFLRGEHFAGLVGLLIVSALLAFLFSHRVKAAFH
jgi:hypothetical protein